MSLEWRVQGCVCPSTTAVTPCQTTDERPCAHIPPAFTDVSYPTVKDELW